MPRRIAWVGVDTYRADALQNQGRGYCTPLRAGVTLFLLRS